MAVLKVVVLKTSIFYKEKKHKNYSQYVIYIHTKALPKVVQN